SAMSASSMSGRAIGMKSSAKLPAVRSSPFRGSTGWGFWANQAPTQEFPPYRAFKRAAYFGLSFQGYVYGRVPKYGRPRRSVSEGRVASPATYTRAARRTAQ